MSLPSRFAKPLTGRLKEPTGGGQTIRPRLLTAQPTRQVTDRRIREKRQGDMGERPIEASTGIGRGVAAVVLALVALAPYAYAQPASRRDLTELSLEELANIQVTSVSRRAEPLRDAPASIFVITSEDIRRSGATSLAEALRLAPNLQVARIDAGQYAISARGFNGLAANKLLVLVDGRTIYTPLFSGVFWDQQDALIEDIERIEVISGPGATLWGANAVNGVINVITRLARDTHGALVSLGGGNRQQVAALRYGRALGDHGHFRLYGKATHLENTQRGNGTAVRDGRDWLQAGFRADWGDEGDGFTLQGDAYRVKSEDRGVAAGLPIGRAELSGANVLGRWTRRVGEESDLRLQAYVDHAERNERILFQPESDLFDFEVQHGLSMGAHRLVWGAGYRYGRDDVEDGFLVGFRPKQRELNWINVYAQADVQLHEALDLKAGVKLEHNDYTGWEYLPNLRLAWKPAGEHLIWAAVSRAVRAPARFDRDVIRPLGGVFGGPNFAAEVANVFQLGYRAQLASVLTWSVTAFRHDWDKLRSATALPVFFENRIEGPVYGVETWASWQPLSVWRLSGGLTTLRKDLRLELGSSDPLGPRNPQLADDPERQWMLRSSLTLWRMHELDAVVRHVGALPTPIVPAYTAVDARYAWRLRPDLEVFLLGQNLFDRTHPEFNAAPGRSEFERGVFVGARWSH
jgi:iron complex outermembrane receptor protein